MTSNEAKCIRFSMRMGGSFYALRALVRALYATPSSDLLDAGLSVGEVKEVEATFHKLDACVSEQDPNWTDGIGQGWGEEEDVAV